VRRRRELCAHHSEFWDDAPYLVHLLVPYCATSLLSGVLFGPTVRWLKPLSYIMR
jgi:hypothetical protein